jgi:hypothetical protein
MVTAGIAAMDMPTHAVVAGMGMMPAEKASEPAKIGGLEIPQTNVEFKATTISRIRAYLRVPSRNCRQVQPSLCLSWVVIGKIVGMLLGKRIFFIFRKTLPLYLYLFDINDKNTLQTSPHVPCDF